MTNRKKIKDILERFDNELHGVDPECDHAHARKLMTELVSALADELFEPEDTEMYQALVVAMEKFRDSDMLQAYVNESITG